MDNREAVNWLINILADIGKAEHSDLWHYEQVLTEIKDMLESAQLSQEETTKDTTSDTISRRAAIDVLCSKCIVNTSETCSTIQKGDNWCEEVYMLKNLPSTQPEQTKMIKEIRKWINSGNRGSADYFIVDKIEEIIDEYE